MCSWGRKSTGCSRVPQVTSFHVPHAAVSSKYVKRRVPVCNERESLCHPRTFRSNFGLLLFLHQDGWSWTLKHQTVAIPSFPLIQDAEEREKNTLDMWQTFWQSEARQTILLSYVCAAIISRERKTSLYETEARCLCLEQLVPKKIYPCVLPASDTDVNLNPGSATSQLHGLGQVTLAIFSTSENEKKDPCLFDSKAVGSEDVMHM